MHAKGFIGQYIQAFIPAVYFRDEEMLRRCRLLINSSLITFLFGILYSGVSIYIHFTPGIYITLFISIVFVCIPFLFRMGIPYLFCANLYVGASILGINLLVAFSGGFNSNILPWFIVPPVVSLLMIDFRHAVFYAVLCILSIIAFGVIDLYGVAFPYSYDLKWKEEFAITTQVGLLLIVFIIVMNFENGKSAAIVRLKKKNQEVQLQKVQIETKNKEITDSINYARRIQRAILPSEAHFQNFLPDSFILYKPKDIVSGDFFWIDCWGNKVLFAVADCTGHGVPGAFMSLVGHNLLSQAVNEQGLTRPAVILNMLNKGVSKTFRQDNSEIRIKDGMDIALCSIDKKEMKLEYSGAMNPLYLVRKGELIEVKADRFPVGGSHYGVEKKFTHNEVPLEPGDVVYVFSDGYIDQFGGGDGKKFKSKRFREFIKSISNLSMAQQKLELKIKFEEWRGKLEQVDDVLVVGVKI